MTGLLQRIPWFVMAPSIAVFAVAVAVLGNTYAGVYFEQTCENEINLLTGELEGGCGSDGGQQVAQPSATQDFPMNLPSGGAVVASGQFRDGDPAHRGSGLAEVQRLANGDLNLRLANFSVTNGPDLFVYLTTDADGGTDEFLDLGRLTANNGNLNYPIPAGTDLSRYRSVIIWCKQFSVLFSVATLAFDVEDSATATGPAEQATATATTASSSQATATSPAAESTPAATATAIPPAPTATTAPPTATPQPEGPGVVASGQFVDGDPGHSGSGIAEIQRLADGSLNLRLANFSVTNGPDLIVYLSPSADDYVEGGINLGDLRANNGNQNYAIPAGTDLSQVRSVVIWCRSFPTVFAYATLEVQ